MDEEKREKLEQAGWKLGNAEDFLDDIQVGGNRTYYTKELFKNIPIGGYFKTMGHFWSKTTTDSAYPTLTSPRTEFMKFLWFVEVEGLRSDDGEFVVDDVEEPPVKVCNDICCRDLPYELRRREY